MRFQRKVPPNTTARLVLAGVPAATVEGDGSSRFIDGRDRLGFPAAVGTFGSGTYIILSAVPQG